MRLIKRYPFFTALVAITLVFLFLIAIDASPYLRGPQPYPPAWRWPYLFSNTFSKLWAPLLVGVAIIVFAFITEKWKDTSSKKYYLSLLLITLLGLLFELSILYYSRAGIGVFVHRILDPKITSHFSTALTIHNVSDFLRTYDQNLSSYPMYARYHPPFATLIFLFFTWVVHPLSSIFSFLINHPPHDTDVLSRWISLTSDQKLSAVLSGFFVSLLSILTVVPLSLAVKELLDKKSALRAGFLFILVPSILLFLPMNDAFYPLFPILSFYLFVKGLKSQSKLFQFLAGLFFVIGGLFTITSLPLIFIFFGVGIIYVYQSSKNILSGALKVLPLALSFAFGFLLLPFLLLLFYHYNFISNMFQIFHDHGATDFVISYYQGLLYAPYDFLLFLGLPISIFLLGAGVTVLKMLRTKRLLALKKIDAVPLVFWIFLILMTVSGSVRLETARIWTPYIPFAVIAAMYEVKRRKTSASQFLILLVLLIIQVITFQTVLVTVW